MDKHGTPLDDGGMEVAPRLRSLRIDDVPPVEIAPGCTRRGLPSSGQVMVRVIDMAPGTRWPVIDRHDRDELIYIVSGEVIEGDQRYGAGSYLYYQPGTQHQPFTKVGVRMFIVGPATAPQ
jgi:quercetin dioxygenase-like cupin family protein